MPHVISEFRSAFVPARLITDNIIALIESVHAIKQRGNSKLKKMVLQLDMSKAYDQIEWPFLEGMLQRLGFNCRWVSLIMDCVRTVSYLVQVMGQPTGKIVPTRGLRQGDPLSPYLFLFCAEGLSALLTKAQRDKHLHGVLMAHEAPTLSHLFFADDSLLFCNDQLSDCSQLLNILRSYERASGHKINFEKSAACLRPKTDPIMKRLIFSLMRVKLVECHEKYLGLPTLAMRSKINMFQFVQDCLWKKLHGWNSKLLSAAGKEVLIKAVAQALPTYTMGVFQLPATLCSELSSMIARYWWGKAAFNEAMVAKQAWRLVENPSSLAIVADLLTSSGAWNIPMLSLCFTQEDCEAIMSIPLGSVVHLHDHKYWFFAKDGKYSVKSGYWVALRQCMGAIMEGGSSDTSPQKLFWRKVWALKVPNKIKLLVWRACSNVLPTSLNLYFKRVLQTPLCSRYGKSEETALHALWSCMRSRKFWNLTPFYCRLEAYHGSFADIFEIATHVLSEQELKNFAGCVWRSWLIRNDTLHEKESGILGEAIERTFEFMQSFQQGNARCRPTLLPHHVCWIKPPHQSLDLNCDEAMVTESTVRGLGGLFRNQDSEFLCDFACDGPAGFDVLGTELAAMREGLLMAS
ncbi:unnamed protein product [Prunus armeniaca]